MNSVIGSTLETVKYWAGQKLLHSPLHPYYLKLIGYEPPPQTYEAWLGAEMLGEAGVGDVPGYRLYGGDFELSPDANYWLREVVRETGADVVYADEDSLDLASGLRRDPVFKPAWSPELYAGCDYIAGAGWMKEGAEMRRVVHIPRVLFHRTGQAWRPAYSARRMTGEQAGLVSILICSRTPALVADCLEGIRSTTDYAPGYEVILVDHRAGMEALAEKYGVRRLDYLAEFNFSRMCNLAAREARGELLLLLNDDTVPLQRDWMARMAAQAGRREVGACGAFLTYPDGRIQHAGVMIGTSNGAGHPGRLSTGSAIWPWLAMTREQLAVTGACLMTRRAVWEEMGGLDETYPVNYNDVDFCLRCGDAGYKVILEADARVEHRESTTRATGIRYGERRRFLERWSRRLANGDPYFNPNLTDNELLLPEPRSAGRIASGWR